MAYSNEGDEQERKLFVGGFNKVTTDEDQLKSFFEHYGSIIDCNILRDADKRSRGFGFLLFEDAATVDKIMRAKKSGINFCLDGQHHIEVKRALPKGSREPRGDTTSRSGGSYQKIFVGGLPNTITEDELRHYFESYGRVNQIELLRDRETNRLRGFAFVSFEDQDSADKCIQRRSHEICKKVCEVKRAHNRSNNDRDENGDGGSHMNMSRRPMGGYDNRDNNSRQPQQQQQSGGLGNDVNSLIQQAFLMGQQSLYQQPGLQSAASLNLGGAVGGNTLAQPTNNLLLQALANQQVAPVASVMPMVAPIASGAPANNAATLTQLAQLLQGGGLDPNALGALLKADPTMQRVPTIATGGASNGYSTSYPSVSPQMYNYSHTQPSNYGPAKYDDSKRGYRPY